MYDDDTPPPAVMRAIARGSSGSMGQPSPAGSIIPTALQGFTPSQGVRHQIAPIPQLATPNFGNSAPQWGDYLKQGVNTIRDFQKSSEQEGFAKWQKEIAEQLAALKAQRAQPPAQASANGQQAPEPGSLDDYLRRNRQFESGNDPNATNPGSGATGLYQFLPSTWRGIMQEAPHLGLTEQGMKDEKQQDAAMRYYTNKSVGLLTDMLGRKPTGGELYLMHLLGHSGGANVLKAADRGIAETINAGAINGNPWLRKFKTGRDLVSALNQQFGG